MTGKPCYLVVRVTGQWEEITFAPICAYEVEAEADLHISRAKQELNSIDREFREFDEKFEDREDQEEHLHRLKRAALFRRDDLLGRWPQDYYVTGFDTWDVRFQVWTFPVRLAAPEGKP
jgi:hypothetical protein